MPILRRTAKRDAATVFRSIAKKDCATISLLYLSRQIRWGIPMGSKGEGRSPSLQANGSQNPPKWVQRGNWEHLSSIHPATKLSRPHALGLISTLRLKKILIKHYPNVQSDMRNPPAIDNPKRPGRGVDDPATIIHAVFSIL